MLKWFRIYNKFILVIGGCLLMVAFLIQPVLSMFMPHPGNQPLGTLNGTEITLADQQTAGREITLVRQTNSMLAAFTPEEPLQWLLMKYEANQLGVSASGYEVTELLTNLGVTEQILADLAKNTGMTVEDIKNALRSWLTIQNYKELILGVSHMAPVEKIRTMVETQQRFSSFMQQGQSNPQLMWQIQRMLYQQMDQIQTGAARVSKPVVEHFVNDQQSRVKIGYLQVPLKPYLEKVALEGDAKDGQKVVTNAEIQSLFDQYKDKLPGTSEPYGFGYRLPERVKFEYLSISQDSLLPKVTVSESEAVAYYDENVSQFTETIPAPQPKEGEEAKQPTTRVKPYVDVRDQILDQLKYQKAGELADKIIKTAQTILLGDVRSLNVADGFRVIPEDFKPMPLEQVGLQIQEQFGVLPSVVKLDKDWQSRNDINAMQGIAYSGLMGKARVGFADYIFSVKEIERTEPSANAGLRLQANVVSMPMSGYDGNRYIFRVLDAQKERSPESLDEVRDAVVSDARKLQAYVLQLADRDTWRQRMVKDSLQFIANDLGVTVEEPQAFQRRQVAMGGSGVPDVQGIGQDAEFVDSVFAFAMSHASNDPAAFMKLAADKRSTIAAAPSKLAMYLVRVDEVHPVTEQQYAQRMEYPQALDSIGFSVQASSLGNDVTNPFEFETLSKRVGFVSVTQQETKDKGEATSEDKAE